MSHVRVLPTIFCTPSPQKSRARPPAWSGGRYVTADRAPESWPVSSAQGVGFRSFGAMWLPASCAGPLPTIFRVPSLRRSCVRSPARSGRPCIRAERGRGSSQTAALSTVFSATAVEELAYTSVVVPPAMPTSCVKPESALELSRIARSRTGAHARPLAITCDCRGPEPSTSSSSGRLVAFIR